MFTSTLLFVALVATVSAAPLVARDLPALPCQKFTYNVTSMTKIQDPPQLVTGAAPDANPQGGVTSFTQSYSVAVSIGFSIGGSGTYDKDADGLIGDVAADFNPAFTFSKTKINGISSTVTCPTNNSPYKTTWGLTSAPFRYQVEGYQTQLTDRWDTHCTNMNYVVNVAPYQSTYPAEEAGAEDGSNAEIEWTCCTVVGSATVEGSPVCPPAT